MPTIVGKEVGPIGLGLMGLTWRKDPISTEESIKVLKAALDNGVNLWNGADFYGPPEANSLVLLEKYFAKYPEDADKVVLSIKGASGAGITPDGTPEGVRKSLDAAIAQLNGRKKIDLFEPGRIDPNTPLEVTFKVYEEYVQSGKIGGIGLSEVKASTIKAVSKITKIACVEVELSLFSLDVLENGVAAATAELGIPLVAYSPLSRGFLSGQFKSLDDIPKESLLHHFPRFQPDVFPLNLQLADQVAEIAKKKGVTVAQLAINWVVAQSRKAGVTIIPIPGSTTTARVQENSQTINITDAELAEIEETLKKLPISGGRYPSFVPTEG
ncbi:Aldo/keto reductase [Karstenula rhodostoma CBS 690.94]|uniref:Aldo/keto reductase n=1 Tax=Karstenula rhodostoma CBS 690.94 TaxID=1392251 RepID=A0A9P4P8F9_9PLEO|nr:Aldo/keto reductase [Karstenula rhodostoma CBS 690.94]